MKGVKLYRMVKRYGPGWAYRTLVVSKEDYWLYMQEGWHTSERRAKEAACARLTAAHIVECDAVWAMKDDGK